MGRGGGGVGESRKWEEKMIERSTRWRVCENQNERQTTLLYILEAVGQYLNNSWSRKLEVFFFSGCWTPQAEGLPTFLSPWGQRAALQTAVDYIHLSNLLHLPRCTSCLIHRLCSFPQLSSPSFSEVFMMVGWWISGRKKLRVTRVRGDRIGRLNIRDRRGREEEVVVEKEKCWRGSEQEKKKCLIRCAICHHVPAISCMRGSSDSLFTRLKVSGVSRTETLQNCSMLIPLRSFSSTGESRDWNHHCTHLHGSTECVWVRWWWFVVVGLYGLRAVRVNMQ